MLSRPSIRLLVALVAACCFPPLEARAGSLTSSSGTTSVDTDTTFDDATISGGTVTGSGNIDVTGGTTWTGGTIDATASGKTFTMSGGGALTGSGTKTLRGREMVNAAGQLLTWDQGTLTYVDAESKITNLGTFEVGAAGSLNVSRSSGVLTIDNQGTLRKVGAGTTTFLGSNANLVMTNDGTLDVDAGRLDFDGTFTSSGSIDVAAGAFLDIGAGEVDLTNATVTGLGTLTFEASGDKVIGSGYALGGETIVSSNGGTVTTLAAGSSGTLRLNNAGTALIGAASTFTTGAATVQAGVLQVDKGDAAIGPITVSGGSLELNGGTHSQDVTLTGSGKLAGASHTLTQALTWNGGELDGATSGLTTTLGAGGTIGTTSTKTLRKRELINDTGQTLTWTAGTITYVDAESKITNLGTFEVGAAGSLSVSRSSGVLTIDNQGTLGKVGAGTTTFLGSNTNLVATNDGTIDVDEGRLDFDGTFTSSGAIDVAAGAFFDIGAGEVDLTNATVTGLGTLTFESSGNKVIGSGYALGGETIVSSNGGTVTTLAAGSSGTLRLNNAGTALIGAASTFTTGAATVQAGVLQVEKADAAIGPITVSGGSLELNGGTHTQDVTLTGSGELAGASHTLTQALTWNGGELDGATSGLTTTLGAGGTIGTTSTKTLRKRELINDTGQTLAWTAGTITYFDAESKITNLGTFEVGAAGTLSVSRSSGVLTIDNQGTLRKVGAGTTTFLGSNTNLVATNDGTIDVDEGRLDFDGTFTSSGAIDVAAGAFFDIGAGEVDLTNATVTGLGTLTFESSGNKVIGSGYALGGETIVSSNGGTVTTLAAGSSGTLRLNNAGTALIGAASTFTTGAATVQAGVLQVEKADAAIGPITVSGGSLELNGGTHTQDVTLTGSGELAGASHTLTQALTWNGGELDGATSGLTTTLGAGGTIGTTSTKTLRKRELINDTGQTLAWTAGTITYVDAESKITNLGTFEVGAAGTLSVSRSSGVLTIDNQGTLRKVGAGTTTFLGSNTNLVATNDGTIDVDEGRLDFDGTFTSSGAIEVAAGAFFDIGAGEVDLTNATVTGLGTLTFESSGDKVIGSGYALGGETIVSSNGGTVTTLAAGSSGTLRLNNAGTALIAAASTFTTGAATVQAGVLQVEKADAAIGPITVSGGSLELNGGTHTQDVTLTGSGELAGASHTLTQALTWNGGELDGATSGLTTTLGAGGTIGTTSTKTLRKRELINDTGQTLAWTAGTITYFDAESKITNLGTFEVGAAGSLNVSRSSGVLTIDNQGTLRKVGAGTTTFLGSNTNLVATNDGTIDVDEGRLDFDGTFTSSGAIEVAAGAFFDIGAGEVDLTNATVTGLGTLTFESSGDKVIGSGYALGGETIVSSNGGTVTTLAAGSSGTLRLNNAGTALIAAASTFTTGAATVQAGVLQVDKGDAAIGPITVSGGSLELNGGTHTQDVTLTGSGELAGASHTLTQALTWNGGELDGATSGLTTTLGAGGTIGTTSTKTLRKRELINDTGQTLAWTAGTITYFDAESKITNLGTFEVGAAGSLNVSRSSGVLTIDNQGTLRKVGAGTTTFLGSNTNLVATNDGTIDVDEGRLNVDGTFTSSGAIDVAAGAFFDIGAGEVDLTNATVTGLGTLTFESSGNKVIGSGYALGGETIVSSNGGTVTTLAAGSSGTLRLNNAGTALIGAASTFTTGAATVQAGVLQVDKGDAAIGPITVSGGSLELNGGTHTQDVTLTGSGELAGASHTLTQALTWNGGELDGATSGLTTTLGAGGTIGTTSTKTLRKRELINAADQLLTWDQGTITYFDPESKITNHGTFEVNGVSSLTLSRSSGNLTVLNTGTFRKLGTNQLTISSSSSFRNEGIFEVAAGTVRFAGSTSLFEQAAGSTTLVDATLDADGGADVTGGRFGGTGTVQGDVIVTGGTLAPGQSPGKLTIQGDLTLGAGSTSEFEIAGTTQGVTYDWVEVTGNATLDGVLTLFMLEGFQPGELDSFTILTASSVSGTFANAAQGERFTTTDGLASFFVQYNAGSVVLSGFADEAVPEPGSLALIVFTLLSGGAVRSRRRRSPA